MREYVTIIVVATLLTATVVDVVVAGVKTATASNGFSCDSLHLPHRLPGCAGSSDVRYGSKADVCVAKPHVRLTPNSDRKSGFPQNAMSALPLKADMRRRVEMSAMAI